MKLIVMHILVGSAGTVLFIAGCVVGYQRAALYLHGAVAQGQVVENLKRRVTDDDSDREYDLYEPLIEFTVSGGEAKYRVIGAGAYNKPGYAIGSTVKVIYDPKDPETATARMADWQIFLPELILGLFGFAALGGSIITFRRGVFRNF